jgi:hypothetical protein
MVGKHFYLCNIIIWNIMYICDYCGIKTWNLKVGSLKFVIWYLVVDELLSFISFYVKTYLFFNDSLTCVMNYNYLYIFYLFYLQKVKSYDLRFKSTI